MASTGNGLPVPETTVGALWEGRNTSFKAHSYVPMVTVNVDYHRTYTILIESARTMFTGSHIKSLWPLTDIPESSVVSWCK